ncbi:Glycosyltransferase family 92 [Desulfonatronum zhilinae]|nr:Glycosyltransferase family 92 [Desulfonatronum zhilinae]
MNYFSVCCIAKNEHPFIHEWIDHHLLIGAEKIIIFDNESAPPLNLFLKEYVDKGFVDIYNIDGQEKQIPAYHNCLKLYADKSKWIAFIDVDEFLILKKMGDIRFFLLDYEEYGGLGVHWVDFGSSGYVKRPELYQMKSYIHRFPLDYQKNLHIKSIIQPQKVSHPFNPHKFIYKDPWYCVDENYFPISESQGPFTANNIQLNHYYFRSQQDYCQKLDRGRADRVDEEGKRKHSAFFYQLEHANVFDCGAVHYAERIGRYKKSGNLLSDLSNRSQEKKKLNNILDSIFHFISQGSFDRAESLLKIAKVLCAEQVDIDYAKYRIAKKKKNDKEAKAYLLKLFRNFVDINICFEYVNNLILSNEYVLAHKMILYMRWRFSNEINNDERISSFLNVLSHKIERFVG